MKNLRVSSRWTKMALAPAMGLALAGIMTGLWLTPHHQATAESPASPAAAAASEPVLRSARQMSEWVAHQNLDELAKVDLTAGDCSRLRQWRDEYVARAQKSNQQREKEYAKAVSKAQENLAKGKLEEAIASTVAAYLIGNNPREFLTQSWVNDLVGKVQEQAQKYEAERQWLDSLQLYSDLHTLFEIDARYKKDMQRLARRVRLLAVYTPKTLYAMRKAINARQKEEKRLHGEADLPLETEPAVEEPTFTPWRDYVADVELDMLFEALERARDYWVETTSYETLLLGGIHSLELILTTPELAQEFPGLKDPAAVGRFSSLLQEASTALAAGHSMSNLQMQKIVEEIYRTNLQTIQLPNQVLVLEFTDGAMERLDPFTAVIWPHEANEFEKNIRGTFGGIGIQIGMENGLLKVITPLEDSPAYRAEIQAGDVISAIDGKDTTGITIDQAVRQIMGKPNTMVGLRIKRPGKTTPIDYKITREQIHVKSIKGVARSDDPGKWNFVLDPQSRIGYIRMSQFQEETSAELRGVLTNLMAQGMQGLILDVRFNPGGLLNAAVEISNMFVDHGTIVSTSGRVGRPHRWNAEKQTLLPLSLPVMVLVNQYSASASEILSGAMKDLQRATIVGQRTFGKGSVQQPFPLKGEKALMKLTMSYYYLPNGESLHRREGALKWGVDPDVNVELTPMQTQNIQKARRDSEIIHAPGNQSVPLEVPATAAASKPAPEPSIDTQLETALFLLRLKIISGQ